MDNTIILVYLYLVSCITDSVDSDLPGKQFIQSCSYAEKTRNRISKVFFTLKGLNVFHSQSKFAFLTTGCVEV